MSTVSNITYLVYKWSLNVSCIDHDKEEHGHDEEEHEEDDHEKEMEGIDIEESEPTEESDSSGAVADHLGSALLLVVAGLMA